MFPHYRFCNCCCLIWTPKRSHFMHESPRWAFLTALSREGLLQVQPAYSVMFPGRLTVSSAPPCVLGRFSTNNWRCPATPAAMLDRAGVITVGEEGKKGGSRIKLKKESWASGGGRTAVNIGEWNRLWERSLAVSMATPWLGGPFVLVSTLLQTALTSKWPVVDLRCMLRSREGGRPRIPLLYLSSEALFQTGAGLPSETRLLCECSLKYFFFLIQGCLSVWTVQFPFAVSTDTSRVLLKPMFKWVSVAGFPLTFYYLLVAD